MECIKKTDLFSAQTVISSHKRPLSPPESREIVVQQAASTGQWTVIDDDLQLGGSIKRVRLHCNRELEMDLSQEHLAYQGFPKDLHRSSTPVIPNDTRKSLFPTWTARLAMKRDSLSNKSASTGSAKGECSTSQQTLPEITANELKHEAMQQRPSHSDIATDRMALEYPEDTTREVNKLGEEEALKQEAFRLMKLTTSSNSSTKLDSNINQPVPKDTYADELRVRHEQEGRMRSLLLRSKDVSTQAVISSETVPTSQIATPTTEGQLSLQSGIVRSSRGSSREGSCESLSSFDQLSTNTEYCKGFPDGVEDQIEKGNGMLNVLPSQSPTLAERSTHLISKQHQRRKSQEITNPFSHNDHRTPNYANEEGAKRLQQLNALDEARRACAPQTQILNDLILPTLPNSQLLQKARSGPVPNNRQVDLSDFLSTTHFGPPPSKIQWPSTNPTLDNTIDSVSLKVSQVSDTTTINAGSALLQELGKSIVSYPEQGQEQYLHLPKSFATFNKDLQEVVLKHETLKERDKDLDAILSAYHAIAITGSAKKFEAGGREYDEMRTVKTFTTKVVSESLSGRFMRGKIRNITDNMRRRSQKLPDPDLTDVTSLFNRVIPPEMQKRIQEEKLTLEEEIQGYSTIRTAAINQRHSGKAHKKRSTKSSTTEKIFRSSHSAYVLSTARHGFNPIASNDHQDDVTIDLSDDQASAIKQYQKPATNKREPKVLNDERLALLKKQLASFQSQSLNQESLDVPMDNNDSQKTFDDGDSDVSEERDGAEYYTASRYICEDQTVDYQGPSQGVPIKQTIPLKSCDLSPLKSSQLPDETLIRSMQYKDEQRRRHKQTVLLNMSDDDNIDEAPASLTSTKVDTKEPSDLEFDDLWEYGEGEDLSDQHHTCHRYLVKAQYFGLAHREEDAEYCESRHLRLNSANEQADSIIRGLITTYQNSSYFVEDKTIRNDETCSMDGLREYSLTLGKDAGTGCRVWVEREEFHPSRQAYEDARVRKACEGLSVYLVLWRKTTGPRTGLSDENSEGGDDDDDNVNSASGNENTDNDHSGDNICDSSKDGINDNQNNDNSDDHDDLFGPEPVSGFNNPISLPPASFSISPSPSTSISPPTKTSQLSTITETIPIEQVNIFPNIALANRHAKEIFMVWYTRQLQGRDNWPFIRTEEQIMEDQIRSYGNITTWEREDEFEVAYNDGEDGEIPMVETMVESMKVWVERKRVMGPAN